MVKKKNKMKELDIKLFGNVYISANKDATVWSMFW